MIKCNVCQTGHPPQQIYEIDQSLICFKCLIEKVKYIKEIKILFPTPFDKGKVEQLLQNGFTITEHTLEYTILKRIEREDVKTLEKDIENEKNEILLKKFVFFMGFVGLKFCSDAGVKVSTDFVMDTFKLFDWAKIEKDVK